MVVKVLPIDGIEATKLTSALDFHDIRQSVEEITQQNYANAPVLLEQECRKNNQIYLHRDDDCKIDGFFMVGWDTVAGIKGKTVFLGLSSVAQTAKSKGIGGNLYRSFFKDAAEHAGNNAETVVWWFHTATPIVANAFWKIAPHVAPTPNGEYTAQDALDIGLIKSRYGMASFGQDNHPFVLRRYAKARYADDEVKRLGSLVGQGEHLLNRLSIDERNGDRMLFLGRVFKSVPSR